MKPYCFVLMPFGVKSEINGRKVDFDLIYEKIISPAIEDADLKPIRADGERFGGIIHKSMFERLMLCKYAVADLTTANPNVLYELGIRHGIRPHSTVLIYKQGMRLPFDVKPLRALPYILNEDGCPCNETVTKNFLKNRLLECRNPVDDSPVYQLINEMPRPQIDRLKTDTFRDVVEYSEEIKEQLRIARSKGKAEVIKIKNKIKNIRDQDPAIIIDLFLSFRAVKDYQSMVDLVRKMSPLLSSSILVQEQLGFALM
jgi:hypothetical protein